MKHYQSGLSITYTPSAQKDLKSIGVVAAAKVTTKILAYAANPSAFTNQIKKLKGMGACRLRVGDYRAIFTETSVVMTIFKIGHRRDVYE